MPYGLLVQACKQRNDDETPLYSVVIASFSRIFYHNTINMSSDVLTPIDGAFIVGSVFGTPMSHVDDMIRFFTYKYSSDNNHSVPKFEQKLSHYIEKYIIEEDLYTDSEAFFGIMDPKIGELDALAPSGNEQ